MTTIKQEIDRLYNLSQDVKWCRENMSNEASYYYDLCSVQDKAKTLDEFYNLFPYYNPDINSEYWKQQQKKWEEIWKK